MLYIHDCWNSAVHCLACLPMPMTKCRACCCCCCCRFSRYDGALLQVAKQVDALDQRLREEQEGNMKTLEMLLAAAGAQGAVDAGGAAAGGSGSGEAEETSEA